MVTNPRSHIDPSHFREINWHSVSDRVENCNANSVLKFWNGIVPGYINEMFKPSLSDIVQDHRWHWTYLCGKKYRTKKLNRS